MNILNITSIVEWRGGDAQMYTIYNLLKKYPELNQYILCPENSILFKKALNHKAQVISYRKKNKVFSLISPIIECIKKYNIDILHIHDSSALSAAIIAKILAQRKVKIIFSRKRNNPIKNNFIKKLKYNNNYIYKIVSVSKAVEKIFIDINIPQNKLLTIYDAINVSDFSNKTKTGLIHKELNLSNGIKIIGNISSLAKQKDLVTFINTAENILKKETNVRFVILGTGPEEQVLKKLVQKKKLEDFILFLGFKSNVSDYLKEFDILLMTSLTEGLPLTIYEAFASEIPIVSTKAGGIPEVITDGFNGYLTEIGDYENLSVKCLDLLNDPKISKQFTEISYKIVSSQFDLKNLEENYYTFYTQL